MYVILDEHSQVDDIYLHFQKTLNKLKHFVLLSKLN